MQRLTILVDMDDTIENLLAAWVEYLNNRHGTNVKANSIADWDISKAFPILSPSQVYAPIFEDELWRTVKPKEDAQVYLKRLIEDGHNVYIVTSSNYISLRAKMDDVLFRYFPFITWDKVIIATRKQMIRGDILIDDGVHNLVNGDFYKILVDSPHNRYFDAEASGMARVHTWEEIYNIVGELAESLDVGGQQEG